MYKHFYFFLFIATILSSLTLAQVTNFAGAKIYPGESYNSIIDEIDTNKIELFIEDKSDEYWLKHNVQFFNKYDNTYIGKLFFFADLGEEPILIRIDKVWSSSFNNRKIPPIQPIQLFNLLYDLLEKTGIDTYADWFNIKANVEPDHSYKKISFGTHSWRTVEIYFEEDFYEVSEEIRNDEDQFKDFVYIVIFYDNMGYHKFTNNLYTQVFSDEDLAYQKARKLNIPYIVNGERTRGKVVRMRK